MYPWSLCHPHPTYIYSPSSPLRLFVRSNTFRVLKRIPLSLTTMANCPGKREPRTSPLCNSRLRCERAWQMRDSMARRMHQSTFDGCDWCDRQTAMEPVRHLFVYSLLCLLTIHSPVSRQDIDMSWCGQGSAISAAPPPCYALP